MPNDFLKLIGNRIRFLRLSAGMTQKELGELCGVDGSAIRRYESGRGNPTCKSLFVLAHALGCNLRDIIPDMRP